VAAITELADRLGKAISESPQAARLREARRALEGDEQAKALLEEFHRQEEKIARLQEQNKPIEVDDKHKLRELRSRLVANEAFKRFSAAQVDYLDVVRQVNEAIQRHLGEVEGAGEDEGDQ